LWLRLINAGTNVDVKAERERLLGESDELKRILASIAAKEFPE
jgi:hypothetical protein